MPAMLRAKGKATKIADKILGVPSNMKRKKTLRQRRINHRLLFEETSRVR